MITIGFIGFGEAAFNIAKGLASEKDNTRVAFDISLNDPESGFGKTLMRRLRESETRAAGSVTDLAEQCETIIIAVPAKYTQATVENLLPHMRPGTLIVDVTTAAPSVKKALAPKTESAGGSYVDSPILGPVPVFLHKTPMLACGPGAAAWVSQAEKLKMKVKEISGEAGTASQIKLARSLFTKSFEALLVETFLFARRCGIEETVMDGLAQTMDNMPFRENALRYMAGDLIHAERRAHELEDAVTVMREYGITPMVSAGGLERLKASAAFGTASLLGGEAPKTFEKVYGVWEQIVPELARHKKPSE